MARPRDALAAPGWARVSGEQRDWGVGSSMRFNCEYHAKTDEELLRLALTPDQLTEDTNYALSAELNARGIGRTQRLADFRVQ